MEERRGRRGRGCRGSDAGGGHDGRGPRRRRQGPPRARQAQGRAAAERHRVVRPHSLVLCFRKRFVICIPDYSIYDTERRAPRLASGVGYCDTLLPGHHFPHVRPLHVPVVDSLGSTGRRRSGGRGQAGACADAAGAPLFLHCNPC